MSSELIVRISADVKKLEEGYDEARKQTESLSKGLTEIATLSGLAFAAQTAGIAVMVATYQRAVTEDNKLRAALEATGTASGQTFESLKAMGDQLSILTGIQDETVNAAQTLLLSFNKISGETFPKALKSAADLSVLLGTDLTSATLQVGKALQNPIDGLQALSRVGIRFNDQQKAQIEAFTRTGQVAKAQAIILQTLEDRTGGLAEKATKGSEGINKLKKTFEDTEEAIGSKFLPIVNKAADLMGDFFKKVSENEALVSIAARLLTVGSLLSGIALTGGLAALGIIKVRNAITALELAFGAARVQAGLFWGAATLGISTLITFLPEIIDYIKDMYNVVFKGQGEPKTLQAINTELERMKKLRDDVNSGESVNFGDKKDAQLEKIDAQIAALEKLKQAQEAAQPKQKEESKKDDSNVINYDVEAKKKLEAVKNQNELLRLERDKASSEEVEFAKRRQEIILAEEAAGRENIEAVRNEMYENAKVQREQLLMDEQEYYDKRSNLVIKEREKQDEMNAALRDLDVEQRNAMHDEDLQALIDFTLTEEDAERQSAAKRAQALLAINNQRLLDQKKFGTQYAALNATFHSAEISGAAAAADQLVALSQSKNNTLKSIGKAAALTQIAISTAQGAISAYASLSPIPFVGPALGIAAAAALTAFGIERAATVLAAADGGLVTGGVAGRDSVPAMLMPGELVTPAKNFEEVVGAVRAQRSGDSGGISDDAIGLLQQISDKLDRVVGNTIIQGDFYGDETFIDKLANSLYEAQRTRNVRLVP